MLKMTPADKAKEVLRSIGAVAEITRAYYINFLQQGFAEAQAFELARSAMVTHMSLGAQMKDEDEEEMW